MKQIKLFFLLMGGLLLGLTSCEKGDDVKLTGENGKPSSVVSSENEKVFFYYNGNLLSEVKDEKGFILKFYYENNLLSSISSKSTDKNIMDGNSSSQFIYDGNKIVIVSWAEPSSLMLVQEMILDENGIPLKIIDMGYHQNTGSGVNNIQEGKYYATFEIDAVTKNLLSQKIYNLVTSQLVATSTYEYDTSVGVTSKVDLPLWFKAYWANTGRNINKYLYPKLFLCHANNLIKETESSLVNEVWGASVKNYTYTYNKDKFPVTMAVDYSDTNTISITY